MFEVITSEASYLKSLDILISKFMLSKAFLPNPNMPSNNPSDEQILDRQQYHFLFTGISAIKAVSERYVIQANYDRHVMQLHNRFPSKSIV